MKKIVIIGPESTGKSVLSEQLAKHYNTIWCPEFAREYLSTHGPDYNYEDLLIIAQGQLQLEDKLLTDAKNKYFIDTDMYVMKIWCEVAFNNCHTWILKQLATRKYDLYLLCNIDLPWQIDPLREYPDLQIRSILYKMYKDALINSGSKWAEVSGTEGARLQSAISIIDSVITDD